METETSQRSDGHGEEEEEVEERREAPRHGEDKATCRSSSSKSTT